MNLNELKEKILEKADGGPMVMMKIEMSGDQTREEAEQKFMNANPNAVLLDLEDELMALVPMVPCPVWSRVWVAVHELYRQYGGPEEGGWWYDAGEVVESEPIRVHFDKNRKPFLLPGEEDFLSDLAQKLGADYEFETSYRSSMRPRGRDFQWSISWDPPKNFPNRQPYYE